MMANVRAERSLKIPAEPSPELRKADAARTETALPGCVRSPRRTGLGQPARCSSLLFVFFQG